MESRLGCLKDAPLKGQEISVEMGRQSVLTFRRHFDESVRVCSVLRRSSCRKEFPILSYNNSF